MYGWRARVGHVAPSRLFIPCPRWPTIDDVVLLESEIGKPVVTSCQAYIWYALKMAHVKETITGYGRLMATLA